MNQITFVLNTDETEHIYIDGQPLPFSKWINWGHLVRGFQCRGTWEILTCSCGYGECGGFKDFHTFCGDSLVAWRTYQPWFGETYLFEARALQQTVCEALKELEWLHFFHGDDYFCPCSPDNFGVCFEGNGRASAEALSQPPVWNPPGCSEPTARLLGAICRGEVDEAECWLRAGADPNHLSEVESYKETHESVVQTTLRFAPKSRRLPLLRLLAEHGTRFRITFDERGWSAPFEDVINTGDAETVFFLLSRTAMTRSVRDKLGHHLDYAFQDYARQFYYDSRGKRHCRQFECPTWDTEISMENLAAYKWHARRMKLPSPEYLEVALEWLRR